MPQYGPLADAERYFREQDLPSRGEDPMDHDTPASRFADPGTTVDPSARRLIDRDLSDRVTNTLLDQRDKARAGIRDLLGLLTLIGFRDDCPAEIRDALTNSFRIENARRALE